MREIAFGLLVALAIAPGPTLAADGVLAGFGNIPFGTSLAAARTAADIVIREETCNDAGCQLVYRTTAEGFNVAVWQQFANDSATRAEVLIRSATTGGRYANASQCDRVFNRAFLRLETRYGPPDTPIVLRSEPSDAGPVEVREATFSFADNASIREKRDVTPDGTCGVRLFYRPTDAISAAQKF